MTEARNPESLIPLRPVEFEILLALTGGDTHGYGIIKETERRSGGGEPMGTGTLYRALRRLTDAGLVELAHPRSVPDGDDERRRYYSITPFGRQVAAAEARRLAVQVATARDRDLLSGFGTGEGS